MVNLLIHLPIRCAMLFLVAAWAVVLPPLEKANAVSGNGVSTALASSEPTLAAGDDVSALEPLSQSFLSPTQELSVTPNAEPAAAWEKPPSSTEQLMAQATAAPSALPDETLSNFGEAGQTYWYIQGAGAVSFDDEDFDSEDESAVFGLAGVGISQFFATGHSINAELNTIGFIQLNEDALGLNLAVLWRWHFYRQPDWSLYLDGGAGILATTSEVPSLGSPFNFTPQLGGGVTFRLGGVEQLTVGLRWHHISNADLYDSNPGRDSIMLYGGWIIPR